MQYSRPIPLANVFDARASEISFLPEVVIEKVVQFYAIVSDLTAFAEDLMSDTFIKPGAVERAAALYDDINMRPTAHKVSLGPLDALEISRQKTQQKQRALARLFGAARHDGNALNK